MNRYIEEKKKHEVKVEKEEDDMSDIAQDIMEKEMKLMAGGDEVDIDDDVEFE